MEREGLRSELVARMIQKPGEHPHPVAEQLAIGRLADVRLRHRAVDAHCPAPLDLAAASLFHQHPVDPLPHLGPNGPDALLQRRLLRGPQRVHPGKVLRRRGVEQCKLQVPVVHLPQLLQDPAPQDHLAGQPRPASPRRAPSVDIGRDPVQELRMTVQERRDPLQSPARLMVGVSHVEETALGSTSCAHPRPPGGFWNSLSPPKSQQH